MSRSETEYLRHFLDEARYLTEASRETFLEDETLKRASAPVHVLFPV